VREYIVWRVLDGAIDWFRWEDGEYRRVEPDERGLIESTVFPGLRLDVAKMLAGDLTGIMAALN
jgi:Uma2 family endonuclease